MSKISKSRKLRTKYEIKRPEEISTVFEKIKQTIQAKAVSLRRYQKRSRFCKDKNLFKNNPNQFHRNLGTSQIKINKAPAEEEVRSFWEKIWCDGKTCNTQAPWIEKPSKEYEVLKEREWSEVTLADLKHALQKSSKWKSPGKDKIPNFWLNAFHETQTRLTQLYNLVISDPKQIPKWFIKGITNLLPESDETNNPKNYRSIKRQQRDSNPQPLSS